MSRLVLWHVDIMCPNFPDERMQVSRPGPGGSRWYDGHDYRSWSPVLVDVPDTVQVAVSQSGALEFWSGDTRRVLIESAASGVYLRAVGDLPQVSLPVLASGWRDVDLDCPDNVWYESYTDLDEPLPEDVTAVVGEIYCRHGFPAVDFI